MAAHLLWMCGWAGGIVGWIIRRHGVCVAFLRALRVLTLLLPTPFFQPPATFLPPIPFRFHSGSIPVPFWFHVVSVPCLFRVHSLLHTPEDTLKSSQRDEGSYTSGLARRMANDSKLAVEWVESRAGLELVDVGQMGGHSAARTHRPRGRLSGAAFISGLERAVMRFKDSGLLTIHKDTTLDGLVPVGAGADGWSLNLRQNGGAGDAFDMRAPAVILATGGYSADKGNNSLLLEADG